MPITVDIDDSHLIVRCSGSSAWLALKRELRVPRQTITSAAVVPYDIHVIRTKGWRRLGTDIPRVVSVGWFTIPKRRGARQWWSTFRPTEVLIIETNQQRPARLVLQTNRSHELAALLHPQVPK